MLYRYSIRSLLGQRQAVFPVILSVALAVALVSTVTLIIDNVEGVVRRSGRSDNALILGKGAILQGESSIPLGAIGRIKVLPGLSQAGARPLIGAETITSVKLKRAGTLLPENILLRGVDPESLEIHDQVRIVSGAMPAPGVPGVLIGAGRVGRLDGITEGRTIGVGRTRWPIVGTFAAPGTFFESELWADRSALNAALNRPSFSVVVARVSGPAVVPELNAGIEANLRELNLVATTERDFNQRFVRMLLPYLGAVRVLAGVLIVGVAFAMISTMQALLLRRTREFGTLLAIGFTRRQVIGMLIFESLLLIVVGALIGGPVSTALYGRRYVFEDWNLVLRLSPSMAPFLYSGLVLAFVAGLGLLISFVQVRRLVVLDALRSG